MSVQIQAPDNHLMLNPISRRGWFTLLPVVLATPALLCDAFPRDLSTIAKMRPEQTAKLSRSASYGPEISPAAGRSIEPAASRTARLLAQNQQPPPAVPEPEPPSGEEKPDLNDQIIRDVLGPLQRGMESHNLVQVLAIFDQQQTTDYAQIRDQLRAFFDQYDAIHFRYQLLQATSDKNHGSAVAEIEMDATPADPSQVTLRRDTQMRFRMDLGRKGWRLVGFSPADFFAQ